MASARPGQSLSGSRLALPGTPIAAAINAAATASPATPGTPATPGGGGDAAEPAVPPSDVQTEIFPTHVPKDLAAVNAAKAGAFPKFVFSPLFLW